ncbi:MAG: hypothetical protein J7604_15115 [Sporocytophaga sp.]|uniref:hypothetical protein n=1 Tax=Sporocytophaga sp. TaxID=2231183 RepID=UPI001B160EF3|nr:hypothetical protein [Sporocytophaga sp.]MBO9701537.1 hypothetical protein [Sporocytophaga sp.]
MKGKFTATLIGLAYSLFSILTAPTYLVPILISLPTILLEAIIKVALPNEPAETSGVGIILILSFLSALSCLYLHYSITEQLKEKKNISTKSYTNIFTLLLFIVHPLGFYIYLSQNWSMAKDGQIIMSTAVNFFYSSFVFLALGISADVYKYLYLKFHKE